MATIYPTSVPSKRLAASLTAASSSLQLNDILGWNGSALTSADFGTKLYAVLRNEANTQMELMELDPSTIASASITILRRGLKFTGDLTTEVTANKLIWIKNETIVELGSDSPQLLNSMVQIYNDQTITGIKTFSDVPASTAAPVSDNDLVRKSYVDALALGSATANRVVAAGTAGETLVAGNGVYFDETDNEWKKWDADTAATVQNVLLGIAQGAGVNGGAISGGVLLLGLDSNQSGMTQGDLQYAGNTAGGISSSAGTTPRVVGVAVTATTFYFDPNFYYVVTHNQKAAMQGGGSFGTPSSTNKFATEEYVSSSVAGFGDGSDGDVTISSPTTLSRDMYYDDLTVNDVLTTAGWRIFVKGTLSGSGTIKWGVPTAGGNGGNASGETQGSGGTAGGAGGTGPLVNTAGKAGAAGGSGGAGSAGSAGDAKDPSIGVAGVAGGAGAAGSGTSAGAAGAGGAVTAPNSTFGVMKWRTYDLLDIDSDFTIDRILGSAGAGSGGGGGGNSGGGGSGGGGGGSGASGGIVFIAANIWAGTFGINVAGANGGNGGTGTGGGGNGGGGAGGSGGVTIAIYRTKTWSGSYTLTGGTGGTGANSGTTGTTGVSYEYSIGNLI